MATEGGTFVSATGGTFETAMPGTFVSAAGGTFETVMGGTIKPLPSKTDYVYPIKYAGELFPNNSPALIHYFQTFEISKCIYYFAYLLCSKSCATIVKLGYYPKQHELVHTKNHIYSQLDDGWTQVHF